MHIELPEKRYYKIGEVAKAFDVNTSLIRFGKKNLQLLNQKKTLKVTDFLLKKTFRISS